VIIVPLFPWETRIPRDFNDLITLMKITSRLFSFRSVPIKKEDSKEVIISTAAQLVDIMASPEKTPKALLSSRLPYIIDEVNSLRNITNIVKEKAQEQFDTLKIEEAYASDFAIEIISSSRDVLWRWREDFQYNLLSERSSDFLYEMDEPFPIAISVVACRIILCDNLSELKIIVEELGLEKIKEGLYIGGEKTSIKYNMFNFISGPWREIFISNPIATLKPENLIEQGYHDTVDELGFLLSMIHSIGKFYVISESIKYIRANLEWSSWYLDDLFERYESKFCWVQRIFSNLEKGVYKVEKDIKSQVLPLSRIVTSPESVTLIERVYGADFLPYIGNFLSLLRDFRAEKYKIPIEDLIKSAFDNLRSSAKDIIQFRKEFSSSRDSWKELRRSTVTRNQLLLALLGVLITLVINILLKLF